MTPTELLTPLLYPPKATDRNRTGNLQITNQVLCQLSYGGGDGEGYPSVVASAPGPRKSAPAILARVGTIKQSMEALQSALNRHRGDMALTALIRRNEALSPTK